MAAADQPHAHAPALLEELDVVRERGIARERDEAVLGESSLAGTIFDHSGHAVGSIGVVGETERIMPRGPAKGIGAGGRRGRPGRLPRARRAQLAGAAGRRP